MISRNLLTHGLDDAVIFASGGFGADFTNNSLLAQFRPDLLQEPSPSHSCSESRSTRRRQRTIISDVRFSRRTVTGTSRENRGPLTMRENSKRMNTLFREHATAEGCRVFGDQDRNQMLGDLEVDGAVDGAVLNRIGNQAVVLPSRILFCFYCALTQWRRGACRRRNYITTSARLSCPQHKCSEKKSSPSKRAH